VISPEAPRGWRDGGNSRDVYRPSYREIYLETGYWVQLAFDLDTALFASPTCVALFALSGADNDDLMIRIRFDLSTLPCLLRLPVLFALRQGKVQVSNRFIQAPKRLSRLNTTVENFLEADMLFHNRAEMAWRLEAGIRQDSAFHATHIKAVETCPMLSTVSRDMPELLTMGDAVGRVSMLPRNLP
jgi:hypothetical protein